MSTATLPAAARSAAEPSAARREGAWRYFFVAVGVLYIVVAVAGFTPSYQRYFAGTRDIHWFAHVHGALMASWLGFYVLQAALMATGNARRHRTLGIAGVALGAVIWVSMIAASVRVRLTLDPPVDSFLWDVMGREAVLAASFAVFFVSAVLAVRNPAAHKRLMTFATAVLLQSAVDRLPVLRTLATYAPELRLLYALSMYALIAPLVVFDVVTLRRVHRATIVGIAVMAAGHFAMAALDGNFAWHELAHGWFAAWAD